MKSKARSCTKCGNDIYFDDTKKSPRGKSIPLDVDTGEPHDCPMSENKSIGQALMELEEKERNRYH